MEKNKCPQCGSYTKCPLDFYEEVAKKFPKQLLKREHGNKGPRSLDETKLKELEGDWEWETVNTSMKDRMLVHWPKSKYQWISKSTYLFKVIKIREKDNKLNQKVGSFYFLNTISVYLKRMFKGHARKA